MTKWLKEWLKQPLTGADLAWFAAGMTVVMILTRGGS